MDDADAGELYFLRLVRWRGWITDYRVDDAEGGLQVLYLAREVTTHGNVEEGLDAFSTDWNRSPMGGGHHKHNTPSSTSLYLKRVLMGCIAVCLCAQCKEQ